MKKAKFFFINLLLNETEKILIKEALGDMIWNCRNEMSDTVIEKRNYANGLYRRIETFTRNAAYQNITQK